jgi:hypothetical protein
MSIYSRRAISPPICYICDITFRTWQEKREHDTYAHDRYNSTDTQKMSWDQSKGRLLSKPDDYFVCGIHAKKLTEDFKCPNINCSNSLFMRKSEYLKMVRDNS